MMREAKYIIGCSAGRPHTKKNIPNLFSRPARRFSFLQEKLQASWSANHVCDFPYQYLALIIVLILGYNRQAAIHGYILEFV